MNVIRDRFSILIIFCVLCLRFESAQVQASHTDQMNETSSASPRPDEPHESWSVKAPELQESSAQFQNETTQLIRGKVMWDSNLTVTLNTSKTEFEESKKSTRKRKSEMLINKQKDSDLKASSNTTTKDIEQGGNNSRTSEGEKLSNQDRFLKKLEEIDSRKKSEDKSNSPDEWWPMIRGRKGARNESEEKSFKDGEHIAEQKNNEVDQEARKQFTDKGRTIYMRQKEDGNDNKGNNYDEEEPPPELLNVYSLREDMIKILGSISNINASVGVIGRTAEYNDIVLCKITEYNKNKKTKISRAKTEEENKYTDEEAEKKIVFIVHGLSVMGFNEVPCLNRKKEFIKLLKLYTAHLDKFDIYLIPIANPDGVSEHMPLSNKNKSPQAACSGVALDRNFDVSWNAYHVNSCHQQYPGPSAFSEPESRAVGDMLHQFNNRIAAYINVHAGSYSAEVFKGDAVLFPKGFVEFNSDDDKYMDIKGEIDESLRTAGFKVISVTVDSLYNWYGKVTGTSVDYASSVYGIPYALEFVMQPYEDDANAVSTEKTSENVLTEIWKRVIDVVFMNIHRNNQNNEINK